MTLHFGPCISRARSIESLEEFLSESTRINPLVVFARGFGVGLDAYFHNAVCIGVVVDWTALARGPNQNKLIKDQCRIRRNRTSKNHPD
jgi:hypothetical protein